MKTRDWPSAERPREKLLTRGAAVLSNAELLALFLGAGRDGKSAVEASRDLLVRLGGLRALLELEPAAMSAERGLGPAAIARLHGALELCRRHLAEELDRPDALADPAACATYLRARLRSHAYEVFAVLFLDNRHRPIAFEEMFRGSIHGASVYPREVVRRCLQHNAAAVIFAHNHPSGVAEPSQADREITAQLKHALGFIEVRVLDHFIVGGGVATMSFAERGLL